jgi:hypothetical protein
MCQLRAQAGATQISKKSRLTIATRFFIFSGE